MKNRSQAFAALVVATALAVDARSANAIATSMQVASATYVGGGNLFLSPTASCPPGEVAVGGGVDVSNPYFLVARGSVPTYGGFSFYSRPDGPGEAPDGWSAPATLSDPLSLTAKVGALCAAEVNVAIQIASVTMPVGETHTATATCPDGSVALSGGVRSGAAAVTIFDFQPTFASGSLATFPAGEAPAPIGWTATARNDDIFERILKVAALCIPADEATVTTQVTTFAILGNDIGGNRIACPEGAVATGGAIATPASASLSLIASGPAVGDDDLATLPDGAHPAPDRWTAVSRNLGALALAPLGVVCAPEPDAALLAGFAFAALLGRRHARRVRARARRLRRQRERLDRRIAAGVIGIDGGERAPEGRSVAQDALDQQGEVGAPDEAVDSRVGAEDSAAGRRTISQSTGTQDRVWEVGLAEVPLRACLRLDDRPERGARCLRAVLRHLAAADRRDQHEAFRPRPQRGGDHDAVAHLVDRRRLANASAERRDDGGPRWRRRVGTRDVAGHERVAAHDLYAECVELRGVRRGAHERRDRVAAFAQEAGERETRAAARSEEQYGAAAHAALDVVRRRSSASKRANVSARSSPVASRPTKILNIA
jgi:hypothetical protein